MRAAVEVSALAFETLGLTFDDVLLVPAESDVLPAEVSTATRLTRQVALEQHSGRALSGEGARGMVRGFLAGGLGLFLATVGQDEDPGDPDQLVGRDPDRGAHPSLSSVKPIWIRLG